MDQREVKPRFTSEEGTPSDDDAPTLSPGKFTYIRAFVRCRVILNNIGTLSHSLSLIICQKLQLSMLFALN
jgi:hypothetical protein